MARDLNATQLQIRPQQREKTHTAKAVKRAGLAAFAYACVLRRLGAPIAERFQALVTQPVATADPSLARAALNGFRELLAPEDSPRLRTSTRVTAESLPETGPCRSGSGKRPRNPR